VVEPCPSEKYQSVESVGMIIPNIWKFIKVMFQTTNQIQKSPIFDGKNQETSCRCSLKPLIQCQDMPRLGGVHDTREMWWQQTNTKGGC